MTHQQADAIYGTTVNSLATCDACGEQQEILSLRATPDRRLISSECRTEEDGESPIIEMLIRHETDIEKLRRALISQTPP